MMLKVGLTGGIGSGKSTVAKAFHALGIPVFNADEETKKILDSAEVSEEIKEHFGEEIMTGGKPDRKKLAALVFSDKEKLSLLNSLLHPRTAEAFDDWVKIQMGVPYIIKEAAILFESGANKQVDTVITISCPEKIRIERVKKRDGIGEEAVRARMKNQWTDKEREEKSQYIIHDNDSPILVQVLKIHETLLKAST